MHFKEYMTTTWLAAFFMFARFVYYPILAPYIKSAGLNDFQTGLVMSAFGLVVFFSAPIIGHLSDKIGRRVIMLAGMLFSILSSVLFIIDEHWWTFLLARAFMAIGFVAVVIVGIARIEDHIDDKDRGKYSGLSLTLIDAARILAPPLGGLIADYYFVKLPFLVAIIVISIQVMYLLSVKKKHNTKDVTAQDFNIPKILKEFITDKHLRGMALMGMVMHATLAIQAMFLPILIKNEWGMPYRYVGYALFTLMVAHFLQMPLGKLTDRIGSAKAIAMGTSLYGLTLVAMAFAHNYTSLMILLFIWGLWGSLWNVGAWAYMSEIGEHKQKEGEVTCSYISWAKLGSFISFALGGLFTMHYGIPAFMIFLGVLVVLTILAVYPLLTSDKTKA